MKDKVAVIGMGCAKSGEMWNARLDDLTIEAAYEVHEEPG